MSVDFDLHLNRAVIATFGIATLYEPIVSQPDAEPFTVQGVFDNATEVVLDEVAASEMKGAGHSTTAPCLSVRTAAFAVPPEPGDRVTINGKSYDVWSPNPDGLGMIDLLLRELV